MTKIYGHRGWKGAYPENTLLGIGKALELGVDGIEIDVHMSKDHELMIMHDETVDRTTNGTGYIRDLTAQELKLLSAGEVFSYLPNYQVDWNNESIPTLKEVLDLLAPEQTALNIELKTYVFPYPGIEELIINAVRKYGRGRKVVYSSFHLPSLIRLKKLDPSVEIAWLLHQPIPGIDDYLATFHLDSIHLEQNLYLQQANSLRKYRNKTRVWTVNDSEKMKRLSSLEVDAIITDYPDQALSMFEEKAKIFS